MLAKHQRFADGQGGPPDAPRMRRALEALDPSTVEPSYWFLFHRGVMTSLAGELERRSRLAALTVSDVLVSWSRTLVPAAMLAAAVAAFLLLGPFGGSPLPVGVDELLADGIGVPAPITTEGGDGVVSFAAESF